MVSSASSVLAWGGTTSSAPASRPVGVVSNVKVLVSHSATQPATSPAGLACPEAEDISSLEAWKAVTIKDGMTDAAKALAIFETVVRYQHEMDPPIELLHHEKALTDAIKTFNVYGYNQCGPAASHFIELARYCGLKARGAGINGHTVAEVFYDGAWHMYDASYINYFPKADGAVASVAEIIAAVKEWKERNPDRNDEAKIRELMRLDDKTAWKTRGPELLAGCPLLSAKGDLPAGLMDWAHLMRMYDGSKNSEYETGYSMGYRVNVQLRPGERLVRNWSNRKLHINMAIEGEPAWLDFKPGAGPMAYTPRYGDLAPGRVGNGRLEYDVPLGDPELAASAWRYENLAAKGPTGSGPMLAVKDASRPAVLEIDMPTSYVYLSGVMGYKAIVGEGGSITIGISQNNGLDWLDSEIEESTSGEINLQYFVIRRYDYRIRFTFKGKGTGLNLLKFAHDIQHSQRPLPALAQGENTVRFSAGPAEGTTTIEAATDTAVKKVQLVYTDFHPKVSGVTDKGLGVEKDTAEITFPIETPGDMARLRIFTHYRARDKEDGWDVKISFDGGKEFRSVGQCAGPAVFDSRYFIVSDMPPGTRKALVRWSGRQVSAARIFNFRIDADYRQPFGGFRPVKVTYVWDEGGQEKRDEHVARSPAEAWKITCAQKPLMKSLAVELAK
ncbi:MAG: hypothetical protein ACE15C_01990 [Phycisphaerae bacterium]